MKYQVKTDSGTVFLEGVEAVRSMIAPNALPTVRAKMPTVAVSLRGAQPLTIRHKGLSRVLPAGSRDVLVPYKGENVVVFGNVALRILNHT